MIKLFDKKPSPSQREAFKSIALVDMMRAFRVTKPDCVEFDGAELFKFTKESKCIGWVQIGKRGRIYGQWF